MSCPCCGKDFDNLFLHQPFVLHPMALQWQLEEDPSFSTDEEGEAIQLHGRFFLPAEIPLPLGRSDSPIVPRVWLEISEDAFYSILSVRSGEKTRTSGLANLAADIPGFVGTMGAPVRFRLLAANEYPQIISCLDSRLEELADNMGHDEMVALYRKVWGNALPIASVSRSRRKRIANAWKQFWGQTVFSKQVAPPPQLAGMPPAEVLIKPPLDTGEKAVFCTVGCSDVCQDNGRRVEIATWIRNPPEDFVRCFGEFAYISHLNKSRIQEGAIVPEQSPVPGSDGRVMGWVLCKPWWTEKFAMNTGQEEVELLAALPLQEAEIHFAARFGPDKLLDELQNSSADLASLNREPVLQEDTE